MSAYRNRGTVLAASATAALALTLTACGDDGTGTRSAGPAPEVSVPAAPSPTAAQQTDTAKNTGSAQAAGTTGGTDAQQTAGGTKGAAASSSAPVCTTKNLRISAETQDGPPYTHIVLTAKNTSGHSCRMQGFPEVRFLENARGFAPPVAKSKPAAPIVLSAGAPAYALVKMNIGGVDDSVESVKDFSVTLRGKGGMAILKAPRAEGIAVDPANWATGYWTHELRDGADDF